MIITLIGSTRYMDTFVSANVALTLAGYAVFTLAKFDRTLAAKTSSPDKVILDLVHLNKIQQAYAVVIVGDGYIGFSTAREMLWCKVIHKPLIDGRGTKWDVTDHLSNIMAELDASRDVSWHQTHDDELFQEALQVLNREDQT